MIKDFIEKKCLAKVNFTDTNSSKLLLKYVPFILLLTKFILVERFKILIEATS